MLDHIILALLFIIVITIILKMYNTSKQSTHSNIKNIIPNVSNSNVENFDKLESKAQNLYVDPYNESIPKASDLESDNFSFLTLTEIIEPVVIPFNQPINNENIGVDMSTYQHISSNNTNNVKHNTFTNEEIQNYQNAMFDFNEKINQTSSPVDVVDKINQLYIAKNTEMDKLQGKTIGQIFDEMTQNITHSKAKCSNPNCIIPPIHDTTSNLDHYIVTTENGKYFKHGLMYEHDNVSTGNVFYDNIGPYDSEFEESMAL